MKILRYITFLGILFFPFCLNSITFLDVDEVDLRSEKRIRIAIFDAENQKFLRLAYIKKSETERSSVPLPLEGLVLFSNGDLILEPCTTTRSYIARTFGNLQCANPEQMATEVSYVRGVDNKKVYLPPVEPKSAPSICEYLGSFTDNSTKPHFEIDFQDENLQTEKKPFTDLPIDERGVLGELATEMTMITYGYKKLPSQKENGQGFDGVYIMDEAFEEVTASGKFLFLTESKCRQEDVSAENYLIKTLNEAAIYSQVNRGDLFPKTKEEIESFIANNPDDLYKIVQRLKINGQFQCAIAPFDIHAYRWAQLRNDDFSSILRSDQAKLFGYMYGKLQLSPIMALRYALEFFDLSSTEGISLLALDDLQNEQRKLVFSQFLDATTLPLAEQSSVPNSPPTGSSDESAIIKTKEKEIPSTPKTPPTSSSRGGFSLNTPSPSPTVPSSIKTSLVPKKLFTPSTPSSKGIISPNPSIPNPSFGEHTPEKLSFFASLLNGGIKGNIGIGRQTMKKFYGNKQSSSSPKLSDKPFKTLLKGGVPQEGKAIWETFTQNFTDLCTVAKISEQRFLDEWRKKYPNFDSGSLVPSPVISALTLSPSPSPFPSLSLSSISNIVTYPGNQTSSGSSPSQNYGDSSSIFSFPTPPYQNYPGSLAQSGSLPSPNYGSSSSGFAPSTPSSTYQNYPGNQTSSGS